MTVRIDKSPSIKSQKHPLDELCINTIRTLAIDAIQAANSGHPGTPMAMAPVGYYLWQYLLRFDPQDPIWPNRDRFVLSAGHASMLLYALLHLTGVRAVSKDYERLGEPSVPLEAIKTFRQWHSRCPGHPEYRWTSGVETTTGPLGQGLANSVGMALAGRWMAAHFNRPGYEDLIDFNVYSLCGDGCMMEGISSEAASLAGHWKLSNLCWIYDNNHVTIEGNTALAFTEDVATRFTGYGWNVTRVGDANDLDMLDRAFGAFHQERERPTLIIVDSHIGWGAPTSKIQAPRTASPWARRRSGSPSGITTGPRTPSSSSPTASTSISVKASAAVERSCATPGSIELGATRSNTPSWPTSCTGCNIASSPTAGRRACRASPLTAREWPLGTHLAWF